MVYMKRFNQLKLFGQELENETKYMKHKFQIRWVEKLIRFYRENEGKSLIHLCDIEENLFLKLNTNGKNKLQKNLNLKKNRNKNSLRSVKLYLKKRDKFLSLQNLKNFLSEDINEIEPHIEEIKTTKSGIGKPIKKPKFPINLNTNFGAVLLGIYPDATIRVGKFVSKDIEIFSDLKKYFMDDIGYTKITVWKKGSMHNMQLSPILKILYKLSGIKTNSRQIIADNGLPYWVFDSTKDFQKLLLRKLWDAEGSAPVSKKMCFGQSIAIKDFNEYIPLYPRRKAFTQIKNKRKILSSPPNLLVSIQLMMLKFDIVSYIKPHRIYRKKNGLIVCDWHLIITRYPNIKNFFNHISFGLKRKQIKLKECLNSYTRNFPKNPLDREDEIKKIVYGFKKFTIMDIEGKVDLSQGTIRNYLTRLHKANKIEKIGTIPQRNGRSFYNEYKVKR